MYPLLVGRDKVKLREVRGSGDFSVLEPAERRYFGRFLNPLMKHEEGDMPGVLSGQRSALAIAYSGQRQHVIKIKGCGNFYSGIDTEKGHIGQPLGGQTQSCAKSDIAATKLINELLSAEGVPNAIRPLGIFNYDGYSYQGEQCSASVYECFGDTRLDEFVGMLMKVGAEKNAMGSRQFDRHVGHLLYDIGKYCGSLINILYSNRLIWGTRFYEDGDCLSNAHGGNFIVFYDADKNMRIGMADFDAESLAEVILNKNMDLYEITNVKHADMLKVMKRVGRQWNSDKAARIPKKYIQMTEMLQLLFHCTHQVFSYDHEKDKQIAPPTWPDSLSFGFVGGFRNPRFDPIPFDYDKLTAEAGKAAVLCQAKSF